MFFYITSSKFKHKLQLYNLGQVKKKEWLKQASEWTEKKWGYVNKFKGVEYQEKLIDRLKDNFYIVTYAKQVIGMFALCEHHDLGNTSAKELMFVYVDESFRGIGIGGKIIRMAKAICLNQGNKMIVLDTLNPNLNRFYEKHGAKVICDGQLIGQPTTLMMMPAN